LKEPKFLPDIAASGFEEPVPSHVQMGAYPFPLFQLILMEFQIGPQS
jgi:hypothetical protein